MTPGPLLAIDTTADAVAVAAGTPGRTFEVVEEMRRGQAERVVPLAEAALSAAGVDWPDLTRVVVCVGPAGFTGARVGVAAARAFAVALEIEAIGLDGFALFEREARRLDVDAPLIVFGAGDRLLWRASGSPAPPTAGGRSAFDEARAEAGFPPVVGPGDVADRALARTAPATLLTLGAEAARAEAPPAPWYLRPPDAAPPRDGSAPRLDDA